MSNIDFVPNDYVQQRESNRINFMCLVFFGVLMGAIGITFSVIKVRQKAVAAELWSVNNRMANVQQQIAQLDELKIKSKAMLKTMVMTSELLEPIPKSIILACLTNNLPAGVSLLELRLKQEEKEIIIQVENISQFETASANASENEPAVIKEKISEITIEIGGIAPSDIEVANYIAKLNESVLLDDVLLVESREHNVEKSRFREFKLEAIVRDIQLTHDDVTAIKKKGKNTI